MWRVYIIKSKDHDWYYIGMSQNPFDRLKYHNSGKVRSTKYKNSDSLRETDEEITIIAIKDINYISSQFDRNSQK